MVHPCYSVCQYCIPLLGGVIGGRARIYISFHQFMGEVPLFEINSQVEMMKYIFYYLIMHPV